MQIHPWVPFVYSIFDNTYMYFAYLLKTISRSNHIWPNSLQYTLKLWTTQKRRLRKRTLKRVSRELYSETGLTQLIQTFSQSSGAAIHTNLISLTILRLLLLLSFWEKVQIMVMFVGLETTRSGTVHYMS